MNTAVGYFRVWLFEGCELCYSHCSVREGQQDEPERERAKREVAWQWEVSDRIFGATAARLSANWVLRRLGWVLIGSPSEGSSPSLADRMPLSWGHTAQFKTCCCRLCMCVCVCVCVCTYICVSQIPIGLNIKVLKDTTVCPPVYLSSFALTLVLKQLV